jgi:SAM-dependent methyltransferase
MVAGIFSTDSLRTFLHRFRYTPFHPQWFAYRYERQRYEEAGRLAGGRVLDIGCGRQPLRAYLHSACTYFGLDYPQTGEALYEARPNVFGDAHGLPFIDGAFDTVVLLEVLEHPSEPETAIREARRVLARGGVLIISTPFLYPIHDAPGDFRRWTRHGIERLVQSSGFVVQQSRAQGSPVECGILLLNLSLAWQTLHTNALARLPLMLLSVIAIPLLNLLGAFVSVLCKKPDESPFAIGYLLLVKDPLL